MVTFPYFYIEYHISEIQCLLTMRVTVWLCLYKSLAWQKVFDVFVRIIITSTVIYRLLIQATCECVNDSQRGLYYSKGIICVYRYVEHSNVGCINCLSGCHLIFKSPLQMGQRVIINCLSITLASLLKYFVKISSMPYYLSLCSLHPWSTMYLKKRIVHWQVNC